MNGSSTLDSPIPVTCFTGFLGAGKTTTIINLLKQLPKDYKVVLLKNEYGDVEVDSLLANQSQLTSVSEILNGCLCCTMVGLVENALIEIRDTYKPDRIIIESSGSAFPATLALQIRQLEPQGFKLDGVVTVIDCVNFTGYEDTSPSAKLQARYTDLLLLNKHDTVSERNYDILMDHLGTLNDTTPRIRISPSTPPDHSVVFGLDTKLFMRGHEEKGDWANMGGKGEHGDEIETRSVWRGVKPGTKRNGAKDCRHGEAGCGCVCEGQEGHEGHGGYGGLGHGQGQGQDGDVNGTFVATILPLSKKTLQRELEKLNFEIYRVKGLVRLSTSSPTSSPSTSGEMYILNYAFGRYDLTPYPPAGKDMAGVEIWLTVMGERGEVHLRAKKFAEGLGAEAG